MRANQVMRDKSSNELDQEINPNEPTGEPRGEPTGEPRGEPTGEPNFSSKTDLLQRVRAWRGK
jgi:hypothetical protein